MNNFKGNPITSSDIAFWIRLSRKNEAKRNAITSNAFYGTHSIRCGAALALYLSGCSIVNIMLQGRWSSDAFIIYIKRSVLERSQGIAIKMIANDDLTLLPSRSLLMLLHRNPSSLSFGSNNASLFVTSPNFHLHH